MLDPLVEKTNDSLHNSRDRLHRSKTAWFLRRGNHALANRRHLLRLGLGDPLMGLIAAGTPPRCRWIRNRARKHEAQTTKMKAFACERPQLPLGHGLRADIRPAQKTHLVLKVSSMMRYRSDVIAKLCWPFDHRAFLLGDLFLEFGLD
jgi:hypothetical protein